MCDFCLTLALALPRPAGIGNLSRETAIAFARSYVPGVETAIAFAGGNWVFLLCFSVAVVLSVSTVAVQGCAVAMGVSCWPASVAAEASLVSKLPCRSILCAKKFALLGPGRSRPKAQTKRPPTRHAGAGGMAKAAWSPSAARNVWKVRSHKQCKRHYSRKRCKRRALTSSRASLGTRWSRAAGSRRAGRGGSRPRARGAR